MVQFKNVHMSTICITTATHQVCSNEFHCSDLNNAHFNGKYCCCALSNRSSEMHDWSGASKELE